LNQTEALPGVLLPGVTLVTASIDTSNNLGVLIHASELFSSVKM